MFFFVPMALLKVENERVKTVTASKQGGAGWGTHLPSLHYLFILLSWHLWVVRQL